MELVSAEQNQCRNIALAEQPWPQVSGARPVTRPAFPPPLFRIPAEDIDHVLMHTEEFWKALRGCRIFVTGGTGFFGKWLLASFAAANDRLDARIALTVLSRNPERILAAFPELQRRADLSWCRGDVRDFAFPDGSFPYVVHAATSACEKLNVGQPMEMFDTIVEGTRRVLEFAQKASTQALLLTSSGAIYGRQPPELNHIPEDFTGSPDPLSSRSAYGEGKRAAEFLAAASGLPVKIARCFAFIGPHLPLDAHFAAGNFIRDALHGGPIVVTGDGSPLRSYMYPADLVIWLITILVRARSHRAYNVGSDHETAVGALAKAVSRASGQVPVEVMGTRTSGSPARYVPSIRRAGDELGLSIRINLEDSILRTYAWSRAHYPKCVVAGAESAVRQSTR